MLYLLSPSCHHSHCKKSISHNQTLRLNRIFSNNEFFNKRSSDLEKYLLEKGYSEKVLCKEIPLARAISRDTLLEKINNQKDQNKITFNLTYYLVFRDIRTI